MRRFWYTVAVNCAREWNIVALNPVSVSCSDSGLMLGIAQQSIATDGIHAADERVD